MDNDQLILLDFVAALQVSDKVEDLFATLERSVVALGFDGISYTYVPQVIADTLEKTSPVFFTSGSYSSAFINHYGEANLGAQDFTIKRIASGDMSQIHWWHEVENRTLSRFEKRVLEIMRYDYQMTNGISIPTLSSEAALAGVSLFSGERGTDFDLLYREKAQALQVISRIFHDRVHGDTHYKFRFYEPFLNQITNGEKRILAMLAKGIQPKAIAIELEVTEKYVNNVTGKLKDKFNVKSRNELLYVAGNINFIELYDVMNTGL
ncbi:MAG: autoinducer binding domain-containing protein [Pseudomonadales bacterium]|nr:autoinducer binding domain-containing protein [Pseudomonadales bacterium]